MREVEQLFACLHDFHRLPSGERCRSPLSPLAPIVEARPHLTPRGNDESVEQGVAWSLKIVTFFKKQRSWPPQELSCGEETKSCRLTSKGSKVLGVPFGLPDLHRSFLRRKIARSHPSCVAFAVLLRRCTCKFLPEITQAWPTRSSVFLKKKNENCSSMQSLLRCTDALEPAGFEVPS